MQRQLVADQRLSAERLKSTRSGRFLSWKADVGDAMLIIAPGWYLRLGTAKDDRAQLEKAAKLFDDVAKIYLWQIEVERYQEADQYCKQATRQLETLKNKPGGQTKIRGDAST